MSRVVWIVSVFSVVACGDDDVGLDAADVGPDAAADVGFDAPDAPDGGFDAGTDAGRDGGCAGRCGDPLCAETLECAESTPEACRDGIDNDEDRFIDCRDFDCTSNPAIDFCGPENTAARCTDAIDNDGDGRVDCEDGECLASGVCELRRVRVVAANLTSGTRQDYDGGEGLRIMEGIQGDVYLVQELNFGDGSSTALTEFAMRACGAECEVVRQGGGMIPNGIVSRFPILDSGFWDDPQTDTREFVWARIDVPGDADLWAVSVHFLTSGAFDRDAQARAIVASVEREVPGDAHLVVGGDFNTFGGSTFAILDGVVETDTRPVDQSGDDETNGTRSRRLDAVLASPDLHGREIPVSIGAESFERGLVVDTRDYMPLIDLAPAERDDSDAPGMQHMAVVRDFAL